MAGTDVTVAAALGIAHYPQDGTQPGALLQRASGLANFIEAGGRRPGAANGA